MTWQPLRSQEANHPRFGWVNLDDIVSIVDNFQSQIVLPCNPVVSKIAASESPIKLARRHVNVLHEYALHNSLQIRSRLVKGFGV